MCVTWSLFKSLNECVIMLITGYTLNCIRYFASANPTSVVSASHELHIPPSSPPSFSPNVDRKTTATLSLPNNATATLTCDLGMTPYRGFIPRRPQVRALIECEGGEVELYNFIMPTVYHSITVSTRDDSSAGGKGRKTRVEKVYKFADGKMDGKGEEWWTTYRYQLEAFVDRVKGRTPQTWVEREDSIANLEWIEKIYEKVSCRLGGACSRACTE
jgi:predicted dehydrogenase